MADRRLKVGFWSPLLFEIGGTETWHKTLWKHLDQSRIEIVGMAVLDQEQFRESTAYQLRKIAPVGVGAEALYLLSLESDVIVAWGIARPNDYLPRSDPFRRPKTVFVSHGCSRSRWTMDVVRSAHESGVVDHFVGVSKMALGPIVAAGVTHGVVIPNGVDMRRFRGRCPNSADVSHAMDLRRQWGVPNGAPVLGMIARMSEEKRPESLVHAIASLPEWHGVLVGKDYLDGRIQSLADHLAPGRVHFPGHTLDIPGVLDAFDELLVPSDTEGFGLSIAEGWAAGVPVIATPVGVAACHPDLVKPIPHNPTGIQISRAVYEDRDYRRATEARVAAASEIVRDLYSAERFGAAWSDFLVHVAGAGSGR